MPRAHRLTTAVAVAWLLAAAGLAIVSSRPQVARLLTLIRLYPERGRSLVFVLATVGLALALSLAVGWIGPAWWRRAVCVLAVLPVPVLLVTSRNIVAAGAAVALLAPALWLGRELATRLLQPGDEIVAWVVGGAFGVVLLGALGFGLGRVGLLRSWILWPVLLIGFLVLLVTARRRLYNDVAGLLRWVEQPVERRADRFALVGLLLGSFWLNLIGALAPEIIADAVRQRLAAAAFFARMGRLATDPELGVTVSPRLGEVLYAVALAGGPLQTTKLVNLLIGLLCAVGVWALGRRLGGGRAALVAMSVFYTMPLGMWLSQTAYIDLFATLFAVAAALLLVQHEKLTWRAAAGALACIGAGLGVKTSFSLVAVGLVVAMTLLLLWRGRMAIAAGVGVLVATVLVLNIAASALGMAFVSARLSAIPGFASGVEFLSYAQGHPSAAFAELGEYGTGRSLADLIRSPLDLTLQSKRYGENQDGFAGYLLLALAPLVFVARPGRRSIALLVGMGAAYLLWFAAAQYLRYGLPIFALLGALGGAAFAAVEERSGRFAGAAMSLLVALLAVLSPLGYLNTSLVYPGIFPYRVVLGVQDKPVYLADNVSAYTALRLLDAEPNATRASTSYESARLYTRVRLSNVTYSIPHQEMGEMGVLRYFDREGYSHIVIDRGLLPRNWDQITALSEEFLRRNTLLVGGDRNAYLYRILPPDERGREQPWARGRELLVNGDCEEVNGALPRGWTVAVGQPRYDQSGLESRQGGAAIRGTLQDTMYATAPVRPNVQYLLAHATKSADDSYGLARLQINWQDNEGKPVGVSLEVVPVSPRGYHLHSMLATAPPGAATAVIYAQAQQGAVWFDDFSLRAVPSEAGLAGDAAPRAAARVAGAPPDAPLSGNPPTGQAR